MRLKAHRVVGILKLCCGMGSSPGRRAASAPVCALVLFFAVAASAQWRSAVPPEGAPPYSAPKPNAPQFNPSQPGAPQVVVARAVKPQILRSLAHDPSAFTQGLICVDTFLYESTGIEGKSSLRRVSTRSGKILQNIQRPGNEFAEGIAILGSELVQLTWKNGVAIRYEFPSLREASSYRYEGEGWGLASSGTHFVMSNGSDTLYFRDKRFEITRKAPVTLNGAPLVYLNELEYARGYVYANVWYKNFIVEIQPTSGVVTRIVDCSELVAAERPGSVDNVLNGIAYHVGADEWYLTGKNWRNVFIVKIPR